MTNPIYAYMHSGMLCGRPAAPSFRRGAGLQHTRSAYLFGDYVCGKIFALKPDGSGGYTSTEFATGIEPAAFIGMMFDPAAGSQSLYYYAWNESGHEVRRITYTGPANRAPTADIQASPTFGPANLRVNFDARDSTDPDGDPLDFRVGLR